MTIKQYGGVFGRNPTFNDVTIEGQLTFDGDIDIDSDLKVDGDLEVTGLSNLNGGLIVNTPSSAEIIGVAGDSLTITARSGDATAANNAGGGFRNIGSATATSRSAQMWLDADGANLGGGDYFYMEKKGNSGDLILSQYSNADMIFRTNGDVEAARFTSTGNLAFPSGQGIDFSATAGTGTSELLDDYEEGVFTATLFDASSNPVTLSASLCTYTKVGRMVTISGEIQASSLASASGALTIGGLPFTVASGASFRGGASIGFASGLSITAGQTVTAWPQPASATIGLTIWNAAAGTNSFTTAMLSDDGRIMITSTYAAA